MKQFVLKAQPRDQLGSRSSAKIRAAGRLPANIYGHKQPNQHISFDFKEFEKFFHQGHRLLTVDLGGASDHGVIKEVQYDHLGTNIVHVDVARVDLQERITLNVPVETVGIPKGLTAGGSMDISLQTVHVEGPAQSIPEKIEVQVAELELGAVVRVKDLPVPEGCVFQHDGEDAVLAIHETRAVETVEEDVEPSEGTAALPDVIAKKKEEEDGAESS